MKVDGMVLPEQPQEIKQADINKSSNNDKQKRQLKKIENWLKKHDLKYMSSRIAVLGAIEKHINGSEMKQLEFKIAWINYEILSCKRTGYVKILDDPSKIDEYTKEFKRRKAELEKQIKEEIKVLAILRAGKQLKMEGM